MATVGQGTDTLLWYHTGAPYASMPQADPDLSIGGKVSSSRVCGLTVHRRNALSNVTIEFASEKNGEGVGTLQAVTDDSLSWTPPGGTEGDAVSVSNGESVVLCGGTDTDKYITVTRTSAVEMSGAESVQLVPCANNVIGGSNFTGAETTSGEAKYRGLIVQAQAAITGLTVWIDSDYDTDVRIADATVTSSAIAELADETTAPGGVSWNTGTSEGAGLSIGDVAEDGYAGLWIERSVAPGATADPHIETVLNYSYTESGTKYYGQLRGLSRAAEEGLKPYLLFVGTDAAPDITGSATAEYDSLPDTYGPLAAGHTYYLVTSAQNEYGLRSLVANTTVLRIDDEGEEISTPPSAPSNVSVSAYGAGYIRVLADYYPALEGETQGAIDTARADAWQIYLSDDGTDPDPSADTPTEQTMSGVFSIELLDYTTASTYLEGQTVKVLVRTSRDGTESENTTVYSADVEWFGPAAPTGAARLGSRFGFAADPPSVGASTVYVDESKNIRFEVSASEVVFYADSTIIWKLRGDVQSLPENGLYTTFTAAYGTGYGAASGSEAIEVGTWDGGAKDLYICSGGNRVAKIDVLNGVIYRPQFRPGGTLVESRANVPAWLRYGASCFQVWSRSTGSWITGMSVNDSGVVVMRSTIPWRSVASY